MVSTADSTALLSDDSSALADLRVPEMHAPWRFGGTAPEARSAPWISTIGIVAIGRNEGDRLKRCIGSLNALHDRTVYVDSGSSDGSVAMSRLAGVSVVELDMSMPFTAGRARNAGFKRLAGVHPDIEYVFFVDGDCEVVAGWLETAVRFLDEHRNVAAVFGGRRERHPHKTIYNMLCDLEWQDCPLGETKACGGDAVMRVSAYRQANGYRADLICGEEPELCLRDARGGLEDLAHPPGHDAARCRDGSVQSVVESISSQRIWICARRAPSWRFPGTALGTGITSRMGVGIVGGRRLFCCSPSRSGGSVWCSCWYIRYR